MDNKNLPVYPSFGYETSANGAPGHFTTNPGIQQRTLIAAICLQGLLASTPKGSVEYNKESLTTDATSLADTLLNHLENTSK